MSRRSVLVLAFFAGSSISAGASAFEWRDLWVSPEQRAARQRVEGDNDTLIEQAPNDQWRGQGYYQKGEYDKAAEAFSNAQKEAQSDAASSGAAYNEATSLIREGEYDRAIEKIDQLLEKNPDHKDAQHNRSIAEKLKELAEQQQDQNEQQNGENGEQGEQQEGQQGDPADSDSNDQQGQPGDSQQAGNPANSSQGASEGEGEIDTESGSAQAEEAAREALEQAGADAQDNDSQANESTNSFSPEPLSEGDQATEQWLRQIEDDPAGLLRRKLELSHQKQYPGVNTSAKPW